MRRQTAAKEGEKELQVLDYQNTNAELMPLVAAAYALIFMVSGPPPSLCTRPCQAYASGLNAVCRHIQCPRRTNQACMIMLALKCSHSIPAAAEVIPSVVLATSLSVHKRLVWPLTCVEQGFTFLCNTGY